MIKRYQTLATDYDGTFTHHGTVSPERQLNVDCRETEFGSRDGCSIQLCALLPTECGS